MKTRFQGAFGKARLVCLLLFAGGGLCALLAGWDDWHVRHVRRVYVPTIGTMDEAEVSRQPGRDERNLPGWHYMLVVRYHYPVAGETYHSTQFSSRPPALTSRGAADALLEDYGPGASVACYYDPADPAEAMLLLPTHGAARRGLFLAGFLGFLGLVGIITIAVVTRIETRPPSDTRPPPGREGWGERDAGPHDPLERTRALLRERLDG